MRAGELTCQPLISLLQGERTLHLSGENGRVGLGDVSEGDLDLKAQEQKNLHHSLLQAALDGLA